MGNAIYQLSSLKIVGYCDNLDLRHTPKYVVPVFELLNPKGSKEYLFPPFKILEDSVLGGYVGDVAYFNHLIEIAQVTPLLSSIDAQPNSALWINTRLAPVYQSVEQARKAFTEISNEYLKLATLALHRRSYSEAESLSQTSINANPDQVSSYIIKAICQRGRGDEDGAKFIAEALPAPTSFPQEFLSIANLFTEMEPTELQSQVHYYRERNVLDTLLQRRLTSRRLALIAAGWFIALLCVPTLVAMCYVYTQTYFPGIVPVAFGCFFLVATILLPIFMPLHLMWSVAFLFRRSHTVRKRDRKKLLQLALLAAYAVCFFVFHIVQDDLNLPSAVERSPLINGGLSFLMVVVAILLWGVTVLGDFGDDPKYTYF